MKGYDFHPEVDLEAIWEYTAEDNADAAERMIDRIEATIEALISFPHQGHRRRSHFTPTAIRDGRELPHSLRAG